MTNRRTYFKESKNTQFMKICEILGADYFEEDDKDGFAIWKMPKKEKEEDNGRRIGICIFKSGSSSIGLINDECDNFTSDWDYYDKAESLWIADTLKKLAELLI